MPDPKKAPGRTATLGASVTPEYYDEYDLIRRQRGDRSLSETVRAALEQFRVQHWRERTDPEAA